MEKENPKSMNLPMDDDASENNSDSKNEQKDVCELDDDMLEGVSGGLVQLVNPSSSRL